MILSIVFLACIPQSLHALHIKNNSIKYLTYNLYTPIEFILLFIVFYKHIKSKKSFTLLKSTLVIYILFTIFFICYFKITVFIPEWVAVNNLIYTAWILAIFLEQYKFSNEKNLDFKTPFFWYVMALLFYAPCTAMIFSMWVYIESTTSPLTIIHAIFNINMYVLFAIGFWKDKKLNSRTKFNAAIISHK
jgi:hypothetical protein